MSKQEEIKLQRKIQLKCKNSNIRLWKNDNGTAYNRQGDLFTHGLGTGTSDLIGLMKIRITKEMEGQDIAVFVALEVKTKKGYPSKEQKAFIKTVQDLGGIAAVVRSVEDVERVLNADC